MKKQSTTFSIVFIALFAALTFLGTTIEIPFPNGAFAHLGNAVLLLAILLIGYPKGALASGIGFVIFDVLNGFAAEAPYFFVESFIVGGAAACAISLFHKKIDTTWKLFIIGIITGIVKILMTQLKNTGVNWLTGADPIVAFLGALAKLPPTIINVITTIVIVLFAYFPLKKAFSHLQHL